MSKILKKPKSENKYSNESANIWLKEYLEEINSPGYGEKGKCDEIFAKNCNIKISRLRDMASGRSPIHSSDIIKFVKETGISAEEILGLQEMPKELQVNGTKIFSDEGYRKLISHMKTEKLLFPMRDDFLVFLDYLICQEDFIKDISEKSKGLLESKNLSEEEIKFIINCQDYNELKNKIKTNEELKKKFQDLITDKKIRNSVRDVIFEYIYDKLKIQVENK